MTKKQGGFTLLELILVIGLVSAMMAFSFEEKRSELEVIKAKETGENLFQYNNAVRSWIAGNIGASASTKHGSSWLKHTSCPGGSSPIAYLPCSFPDATDASPIAFGGLSLTSQIDSSGVHPNQVTTVRTITNSFEVNGKQRANLSGIAAIVASAGRTDAITPVLMASEGSFKSDPATASITMIASNNASTDAWLRTDGSNYMNNSLTFNPNRDPGNREIRNISRILNLTDGVIFAGSTGGASLATPERFIVDANEEILGVLKIENTKGVATGLEVAKGSVNIASGDLSASGNLTARSFVDKDNSSFYVDPSNTSVVNMLGAKGSISANGNISAKGSLTAAIFYDANDNSFYVDPSSLSKLNEISANGVSTKKSVRVGEYLKLDKISVAGQSCTSAGNGTISRNSAGVTLSCQSGVWRALNGGQGMTLVWSPGGYVTTQALCASVGKSAVANANFDSDNGHSYSSVNKGGYSNGAAQIAFCN